MKSTINRHQRDYMLARAYLQTLESKHNGMERDYITQQGITNEDGETPKAIYCIDDTDTFDRINQAFSELPESQSTWQEILEARDLLNQAEQQLIAYALSIAPARERDILAKAAENNYTIRCKLIDLVLRLDASTVTVKA